MKTGLTDSAYSDGSYCREMLRGDILYGLISYAGLEILTMPGMLMAEDGWEKRHRASLAAGEGEWYLERLREAFREMTEENLPFEAYEETARRIRWEVFGKRTEEMKLQDAEAEDPALAEVDYEQKDRLDRMLHDSRSVVLVLEDFRYAKLAREDLAKARKARLTVYALISEEESGSFPTAKMTEKLFEARDTSEEGQDGSEGKEKENPEEKIRKVLCNGPLNLAEIGDSLAEDIRDKKTFILCYGEKGLTDCRNLAVPAYIQCAPESLVGRAMTGQFTRRARCGIYVPAHFDLLPFVPLRRRTITSFRQMAWLAETAGDACYGMSAEEMYRRWPEIFFSVYEEKAKGLPRGVHWPRETAETDWYADFCARRDEALSGMLDAVSGAERLEGWFALDTLEQKPVPWSSTQGEAEGILVHGFIIQRAIDARVILAEGEAVKPRQLAEEAPEEQIQLMLNYLFFMTPRLQGLYNTLRKEREPEQFHLPCGHLDYLLQKESGRRRETFPLYRKACMGMREDGSFVFFHFRLGGGQCMLRGQTIRWKKEDVDPAEAGKTAILTPYSSEADAGALKFSYTKSVGDGRVNLVMIGDRMICARDGDVLMPCLGIVISLERETGRAFLRECGFGPADERGYYAVPEAIEAEIRLDAPAGMDPEEWKRIRWAYGGGLTLIHEGKNCFDSPEAAAAHLAREGWTSPLSEQTQESDIAAPVRHPRTAIGITKDGKLFALIFSGRSSLSAGANYPEMCAIAQKLVPGAWELMNADGGGSSVLGIATEKQFIEMSWPSSSPGTPSGLVRPVQSLLAVQIR